MSSLVRGLVGAEVVDDAGGDGAASVVDGVSGTSTAPSVSTSNGSGLALSKFGSNIELLSLISADGVKQMGVTRVLGLLKPPLAPSNQTSICCFQIRVINIEGFF